MSASRLELAMARRFLPASLLKGYHYLPKRVANQPLTWKIFIAISAVLIIVLPTFFIAERAGSKIVPELTALFYAISDPNGSVAPAALPPFPALLPRAGTIAHVIQDGESCDEILADNMRFVKASEVFSDQKPETVRALNASVGQDCHKIHPDTALTISPQYPLVAFGGEVVRVGIQGSAQAAPTPLIHLPRNERIAPDCALGCVLTVQIAPKVQVYLNITTRADIFPGTWIWSQAAMARKTIANFADYPYVDPAASLNNMSLQACDFQINGAPPQDHVPSSCNDPTAKNIHADGGAWLFAVTGPSGLDHWHYPIHAPSGTRLLLWLTSSDNGLTYHPGNPVYRFDEHSHSYVKL